MTDLYNLLCGYLIYLLLVTLHELGHLLALRWMGFGWRVFQVGPFAFEKRGQETHLVYSSHWLEGGVGVLLRPGETFALQQRLMFYIAGCVVNVVLGLALICIFYGLSLPHRDIYWPVLMACCLSLLMGVSNLLPYRWWGRYSDGYLLREAWRSRNQRRGHN